MNVLGISGSLRQKSWNTGLLRAAVGMVQEGMHIVVFDLSAIPIYNADNDGAVMPAAVKEFRSRIASSDVLLFATPEYNYSVPGVLKNAIDWASRTPKDSPLTGKPIAMMGAGGVMGTVRAQLHLRQILLHNATLILPNRKCTSAGAGRSSMQRGISPTRTQRNRSLHCWKSYTNGFFV